MSQALAIANDDFYAAIAEKMSQALSAVRAQYISTKGKVFTLPSGTILPSVECIIIGYIRVNTLQPPYNPKQWDDPTCWAIGHNAENMIPDPTSKKLEADTCKTCERSKFGSAAVGAGKACRQRTRLAIVPIDATVASDIWIINITPTGLNRWSAYCKELDSLYKTGGVHKVKTKLSFVEAIDYPTLQFTCIGLHDRAEAIPTLYQRAEAILLAPPCREE